jgi:sterol desaturase/sphingolipid hydroxylase (fatty acid hydroxylase superfamily)
MTEFINANEPTLRLGFFLGIFIVVILWEFAAPRRPLTQPRWLRWYSNIGIVVLNTVAVRLLVPLVPVALAIMAEARGWGILNLVDLPFFLTVVVSVVALDLVIYFQHFMFHAVPILWRLHRMHHADLDFDVTTGARFHPIEIVLSILLKFAVIAVIGPPAVAVIIFEVLLNGTSMFNHGNIRLPLALDRVLRWFVVTPDMHRVHHSNIPAETNSNFGFSLPYWDRLFGTYRDQPQLGHEDMTIGLDTFREAGDLHLHKMIIQPFKRGAGGYSINRQPGDEA